MFIVGKTTLTNGTPADILAILPDARECQITGLRQNVVAVYQIEPGRYFSHIFLENGKFNLLPGSYPDGMDLQPNC